METWATIILAAAGIVLQTIALIIGGIWVLARTEQNIRQMIADHKLENEERINATMRSIGETFTALRQKIADVDGALAKRITDIELYVRDTFMQKETFRAVIAEIMNDMKNLGDRIENRLLRMENKLDRAHDNRRDHSPE